MAFNFPNNIFVQANEEWATVEMVDNAGNARYVLIKADGEDGESIDTAKILSVSCNPWIQ